MDISWFFKKYWWVILLILFMISAYFKYENEGFKGFWSAAGISLIAAIIQTLVNNSRIIKKVFRMVKFFLGFGMFSWETNANFLIHENYKLSDQVSVLEKLIKDILGENGIKIKKRDEIDISRDNLGGIKIFVSAFSLYISVDTTDADSNDRDGFALSWLNVRVRTTLRYRNTRKVITGFLIDLFSALDNKYGPIEQKYSMKITLEEMSKNFFKEQFVKEFSPNEIESFSIIVKKTRSTQEVTHSQLNITTNRREELMDSVSSLILRLS
jgi:hypothetical protein